MMPVFDGLLERLDGVRIAHHIRGRIRLKRKTGPHRPAHDRARALAEELGLLTPVAASMLHDGSTIATLLRALAGAGLSASSRAVPALPPAPRRPTARLAA